MRKRTKFWHKLLLIVFITMFVSRSFAEKDKVVAIVNGSKITNKQLLAKVNEKLPLVTVHQRISEKRFDEIRNQILNHLIDEELLVQEAQRRGISVSKKELQNQINMMKGGYASEKIFKRELAKTGQTYKQWIKKIKRRLLIRKLWKTVVTDRVNITDDSVRAYYLSHKNKFYIPDRLHLAHILIAVDPGAMEAGWKAGLQTAENLYRQLRNGADFSSMAKQYSDDSTTAKKGGDLGWRHVGQLLPELDKVAKQLVVGQISKPIRTIYGYHILKLLDKEPGRQLSFEEIDRKALKKRLQKKRAQVLSQNFIDKLRKKAKIQIFTTTE